MARILGSRALAGGNAVEITGRNANRVAALAGELKGATTGSFGMVPTGDIVILALPYGSGVPVVAQYGEALSDKILVDISNPFDQTGTGLGTPDYSSAAKEIFMIAPISAHVVKAFNTVMGHVLANQVEGPPIDVFIAGNDDGAKARVSMFIESLSMRPLDTGVLKMAHWLEGAGLILAAPLVGKIVGPNYWLGINSFE